MTEGPPGSTTPPSSHRPHRVHILLVEDSAADVRLTREALADSLLTNPMDVVTDGEAALAYVRRQPPYEDRPRPDIILLDLNLPRLDGRAVLRALKSDPDTLSIPVVVLTTSSSPVDVETAYGLHANTYVTKPVRFDDFARAVAQVGSFWFELVTLPAKDGPNQA